VCMLLPALGMMLRYVNFYSSDQKLPHHPGLRYLTNASQPFITGYPAAYAKVNIPVQERVPNLLVAGAVYPDGTRWGQTNTDAAGGIPTLFAPGAFVRCADAKTGGERHSSGTSNGESSNSCPSGGV
jgi:hypothetical protein